MKISIIGAGNVGALTAMRVAQEGQGETVLVDIVKGLAQGKAFDLEDSGAILGSDLGIRGTDDVSGIENSDIIVVTAGLARKPGMTREDLLQKNAAIVREVCGAIKKLAAASIVVMVTNPLDAMAYVALKALAFKPGKVFGMGVTLDAARFANLISVELGVPVADIEATVIGSHGEAMLPLSRFTTVRKIALESFADTGKVRELIEMTKLRGQEIVSRLGSGSAFFAPSAAIAQIVRAIVRDQKRTLGVSAYLNGEYGKKDICIGVPCCIGKNGIERIIELDLNRQEQEAFSASCESTRSLITQVPL